MSTVMRLAAAALLASSVAPDQPAPADNRDAGQPEATDGGATDGAGDMEDVIALDEAYEAMDAAIGDGEEALASGTVFPRLHRDALGWLLFDLRTRPARRPDLIEPELENRNGETK